MVYLFILTLMIFGVVVLTYLFYIILSLIQTALKSPWGLLVLLVGVLYLLFKPH